MMVDTFLCLPSFYHFSFKSPAFCIIWFALLPVFIAILPPPEEKASQAYQYDYHNSYYQGRKDAIATGKNRLPLRI